MKVMLYWLYVLSEIIFMIFQELVEQEFTFIMSTDNGGSSLNI